MKHIKDLIKHNGPIKVSKFMEIALYHPVYGYYVTGHPLGKTGDFVTAPEISQLFGEMLGVYSVDRWMKIGEPIKFNLVELGPGRGTLMMDLLRATKHVSGFHQAMQIHLVESNRNLIKAQKDLLKGFEVTWHQEIYSLPKKYPLIIIANEFFDCLPINQYIKENGLWYERLVDLNNDGDLFFIKSITNEISSFNQEDGSVIEASPSSIKIMQHLLSLINKASGNMLIVDYGYTENPFSRKYCLETLQAIKNHKFHSIFEDIGRADLTAHVNFFSLREEATKSSCKTSMMTQGEFLQNLGINIRAEILKKKANITQKKDIEFSLKRLVSKEDMGELFKVLELFSYRF